MPAKAEWSEYVMLEFVFDLLPGNEPPYEYAPGHVTITTRQGTGTSHPNRHFMLAVSLTELLSALKPFLLHGKMSGFTWMDSDTASPEYVLQIDTEPKALWTWGDGGVGYIGRGTGAARDVWTLEWQCY